MEIKILRQALGQVWLIEETGAQHYAELLFHVLEGNVKAGLFDDVEMPYRANSSGIKTPNGPVFVLPVQGIMMQDDFCGELGTDSMSNLIKAVNRDSSIQSIVLKMRTPGGSVAGTENFSNTVKTSQKPVVAWAEMMCSAGYWVGSAANEVVISGQTSMVGSIGTMATLRDTRANKEKNGSKEVVMFATRSVHKNRSTLEALDGKPENYVKEFLDPLNAAFENSVSTNRAGKIDLKKEDVMTGKVYIGSNIVEVGLADTIGSLDYAIKRSLQLAKSIK